MKRHFLTRIIGLLLILSSSVFNIVAQRWSPDSLGHGYEMRYVGLGCDFSGPVRCTLIRHASDCNDTTRRGVLYIHGYNDYFFQTEMGELFAGHCYTFYALDLRKYGRSVLPHQRPFLVRDFTDYFADVDSALADMRRDGCKEIALMGHSTGGLVAAYYMATHPEAPVQALILNSPFFDWNLGRKECLVGVASWLGRFFPDIKVDTGGGGVYAESLEKKFHGEWAYDLTRKSTSYGTDLGWVRAVNEAQHKLRKLKGDIRVPILLMSSARSSNPDKWTPEASHTDVVLDVKDIQRYGMQLGPRVTYIKVNGGMHDLLLSEPRVRYAVYDYIFRWLGRNL